MRKLIVASSVLILLLLGYGAYFLTAQLPDSAHKQALKALHRMGFQTVQIGAQDVRIQAARFENIKLDEDGISTIRLLEIHYSPLSLFFSDIPTLVKIDGLTMIGELSDTQDISISGWDPAGINLSLQDTKLDTLQIQNGRLGLLTDSYGGINLDFDLQTRRKTNQVEIQGRLRSQQQHLSAITNFSGFVNPAGTTDIDLEIERGKAEFDAVKITRINGGLKLLKESGAPFTLSGTLQAGGLNLYGYPWQNAAIGINGGLQSFKISADMKSLGYEGLELGMTIEQSGIGTAMDIFGMLHGQNLEKIVRYLREPDPSLLDPKSFTALKDKKDVTLSFENLDKNRVSLSASDQEESFALKGEAVLNDQRIEKISLGR